MTLNLNSTKIGDTVYFFNKDQWMKGIVYVVDHGSIEYPDKTSYDILGDDGILYKKVTQIKAVLD